MLASPASCGLVALLAKRHILGCKSADLYQELPGRAALGAAIKEAAFRSGSTLSPSGRANVFLAPVIFSAFVASALRPLPLGTIFIHVVVPPM